jgi:methenyltetrahydromethanopterin cyclohydrolase
MGSQYAGWQIELDNYRAMCSGPIRAVYAREKLFAQYPMPERPTVAVGVLEASALPGPTVFEWLRMRLPIDVPQLVLCVARTNSISGRVQIVARSVETACHKLFELGFDLNRICSGEGIAPLPPAAQNDLQAMGSTNDAMLLAGRVDLVVDADPGELDELGPLIPSSSSPQFGRPFLELLKEYAGDFYRIDPLLFAPAEISLLSTRGGPPKTFGRVRLDLYAQALSQARN